MTSTNFFHRSRSVLAGLGVLTVLASLAVPAAAQSCWPITNNSIAVNGVIASPDGAGGAVCPGDLGWSGVVSKSFSNVGAFGTHQAQVFITGFDAADDGTLDTVYLGVHVENDPDLRQFDRIILYFDVDGGGGATWAPQDFALAYEVGALTPITSGETCSVAPNTATFWRRDGGNTFWQTQAMPAGISHSGAYDYDTGGGDPEDEIWEFEIGIDVGLLGLDAPTNVPGFRVGAKLFVHEFAGVDNWSIWHWPAGLSSDHTMLFDPNDPNVLPSTLQQADFNDCADVIIVATSAVDKDGTSNKFYRPAPSDFVGGNLPASLQNQFTAEVRFYNPSNPGDTSPVAVANTGNVEFNIRPWNGGFINSYLMGSPSVSFTHLNQTEIVTLNWPETEAQYNPAKADLDVSGHACLKVQLQGFAVNLNESADIKTRNLTYTPLSTRRDTFVVSAVRAEFPEGAQEMEYLLRLKWRNLPAGSDKGWEYRILNADELGIKELENGYFSMPMRIREEKRVALEISGGDMPLPIETVQVSARAGGQLLSPASGEPPVELPVKPGQVVTIITNGLIETEPGNERIGPNGANGINDPRTAREASFLLSRRHYRPAQHLGALIGSFDKFETSFVIGADHSFIIPRNAEVLYLAVNDRAGRYDDNTGEGFTLNVVFSDPSFLPTRLAMPVNPNGGLPAVAEPGVNLPTLHVSIFQAFPTEVKEEDVQEARIIRPAGYLAYGVYDSHLEDDGGGNEGDDGEGDNGGGGGLCGFGSGQGMVLFFVLVLGGALMMTRRDRRRRVGSRKS